MINIKIPYPSRCFVIETNDKQYKCVKEGDLIKLYIKFLNETREIEGRFEEISAEEHNIEIDCSKNFKSDLRIYKFEDIVGIDIIKENEYEGNYLKEK